MKAGRRENAEAAWRQRSPAVVHARCLSALFRRCCGRWSRADRRRGVSSDGRAGLRLLLLLLLLLVGGLGQRMNADVFGQMTVD
jgi:hypothetical protein